MTGRKSVDPATFSAGVAELNRREFGTFDGLLGRFDDDASPVLQDILGELRDYLLVFCGNDEARARALIEEHEPRVGYRNVTPVPNDVALVLGLINSFCSLLRCPPEKYSELVLGKGGVRDKKRQAGTRVERRPEVNRWIETRLRRNPSAKSPDLYQEAPEWITEQIGPDRFKKRVSAARKRVASN